MSMMLTFVAGMLSPLSIRPVVTLLRSRRWHIRGRTRNPASLTARERYAGYTEPNIPGIPEWTPTMRREGHHVLIGLTERPLQPGWISAHKAKRATEQRQEQPE